MIVFVIQDVRYPRSILPPSVDWNLLESRHRVSFFLEYLPEDQHSIPQWNTDEIYRVPLPDHLTHTLWQDRAQFKRFSLWDLFFTRHLPPVSTLLQVCHGMEARV